MTSLDDLIALLSGIHVSDRNPRRAVTVASHLVKSVLKDRWHQLPKSQIQLLVQASTKRLWKSYMYRRKRLEQTPKEAAKQAIADEIAVLERTLTIK